MKFTAAIFDLDGTLIDTLEDLKNSVNYALGKYGFPERTYDEVKSFVGNGVAKLVYRSAPENADEDTKAKLLADFKEHYMEHSMVFTSPYKGINEMLIDLKNAGVKTAVVTNKMQEAAFDIIDSFFNGLIDVVIGQVDSLPQKPEPDGVWLAIEKLGEERENAVYIGDSDVDCLTAKNSALPVIGCVWGFRGREVLEECGADYIAESPSDVVKIITGKVK